MAEEVSVVIAAFNRAGLVARAVRSALDQEGVELTVVVVDDGSTDATASVAAVAGARVVRQENRERGAARNAGVASSAGEFLCFLDSDDELRPTHLAPLVAVLREDPELGLAYRDAEVVAADGSLLTTLPIHPPSGTRVAEALLRANEIPFSGTVVRREVFEAVGGFDEDRDLSGAEDWELWTRIARCSAVAYVPGRTIRIHVHEENTVTVPSRMETGIRAAWQRITDATDPELLPRSAVAEGWLTDTLVRTYLAAHDSGGAVAVLRRRVREQPVQLLGSPVWKAAARIVRYRVSS